MQERDVPETDVPETEGPETDVPETEGVLLFFKIVEARIEWVLLSEQL